MLLGLDFEKREPSREDTAPACWALSVAALLLYCSPLLLGGVGCHAASLTQSDGPRPSDAGRSDGAWRSETSTPIDAASGRDQPGARDGAAPASPVLTRAGTQFKSGGTTVVLRGLNDHYVFMKFLENNPSTIGQTQTLWGTTDGWDTAMSWTGDYDFWWWRYFWVMKNKLGLNCVRLGATDTYTTGLMYDTMEKNPSLWNTIMSAMLRQAHNAGVYIIFCLAGMFEYHYYDQNLAWSIPAVSTSGHYDLAQNISSSKGGNVFQVGSGSYAAFVEMAGKLMKQFKGHPALAAWDIMVEADWELACKYWWKPQGGRSAFHTWVDRISTDLKAQDKSHMLSCGAKIDDYYDNSIFAWTSADWYDTGDPLYQACDVPNIDFCSICRYNDGFGSSYCGDASCSDWYVGQQKHWADRIGKPLLYNTVGFTSEWYSPRLMDNCDHYGVQGAIITRPGGMPNWPVDSKTPIPPVPSSGA